MSKQNEPWSAEMRREGKTELVKCAQQKRERKRERERERERERKPYTIDCNY